MKSKFIDTVIAVCSGIIILDAILRFFGVELPPVMTGYSIIVVVLLCWGIIAKILLFELKS
jgi:hypothetical protein